MTMPRDVSLKSLSICFRYKDIVNVTAYDADNQNASQKFDSKESLILRMTISELFKYTPLTTDMIYSCKIRFPHEYTYEQYNGSDCNQRFKMSKFYIQVNSYLEFRNSM